MVSVHAGEAGPASLEVGTDSAGQQPDHFPSLVVCLHHQGMGSKGRESAVNLQKRQHR
jgi:hypothetical protein